MTADLQRNTPNILVHHALRVRHNRVERDRKLGIPNPRHAKVAHPNLHRFTTHIHAQRQTERVVLYLTAISMAATPDCAAPSECPVQITFVQCVLHHLMEDQLTQGFANQFTARTWSISANTWSRRRLNEP